MSGAGPARVNCAGEYEACTADSDDGADGQLIGA